MFEINKTKMDNDHKRLKLPIPWEREQTGIFEWTSLKPSLPGH